MKLVESPVGSENPVNLTCETDSANPTPVITWWRNSQLVNDVDNIYTIIAEEIPGEFNAYFRRSTLSFKTTEADVGVAFECRIDGTKQSAKTKIKGDSHNT